MNELNDHDCNRLCDLCELHIYQRTGARSWCEGLKCTQALQILEEERQQNKIEDKKALIGKYGT